MARMVYRDAMPTNKLWLEHTERAAWDSVEALRERLLKAEERLQALLPNVERVPLLLDLLQQAKQKHALQAPSHDQILAELLGRLDSLQEQLQAARTPEPTVVSFDAPAVRQRFDSDDLDDDPESRRGDDWLDLGAFTQTMRRRHEHRSGELPSDLNRLLELAEKSLDDLAELEGVALREAAVDLALLAASIYDESRRKG
jgi:hypothetical protein